MPLTAIGTVMGAMQDVTKQVEWTASPVGATVSGGVVTVNAPGTFTITAQSGSRHRLGDVTATFIGRRVRHRFRRDQQQQAALDGIAAATASSPTRSTTRSSPRTSSPI